MVQCHFCAIIQVMILMKAKSSQTGKKPAARNQTGKVHMPATATGLTSQAGLIPVIKFLQRIGFDKTLTQTVPHQRGDNADYQLADGAFLALVGMIGGAGSIAKLCVVWSDSALRKIAGWVKFPVETTIGRLFKEITEKEISQFESLNHRLRGQIWRMAHRAGVSKVGLNRVQWVDIDSTVDSVCGTQEGAAKGFNPKKKGALSYHPQLAMVRRVVGQHDFKVIFIRKFDHAFHELRPVARVLWAVVQVDD